MPEVNQNVIEAEHISFRYGEEDVLQDVSFVIACGDYVGLVGANGSGKTTLLRVLLGLSSPSAGTVKLFDASVDVFCDWRKIGYVPQNVFRSDVNFPATAEEVVASGNFNNDRIAIKLAMERTGIMHLKKKRIGVLSGGERQRVFIARALVSDPELIILDEPTAGVDAKAEEEFYSLLAELNRYGMTIILVSHDLEAIAREVKMVLCLNRRLICFGNPSNLFSKGVMDKMYGQGKQMIHHGPDHYH